MGQYFNVERRARNVALLRLERPKANALSREVLIELGAALDELAGDLPGAVVLWGGERIFAAGADIVQFQGGAEQVRAMAAQFRASFDKLAALPCPTIAAINGYALGGGCEMAMACDLRVAADNAKLGQPEILLGIIPGAGGTQRLARLVGVGRAKDLILTGRHVDAAEALRIGLVDRVAPAAEVLDTALELAAALAAGPRLAQAAAKSLIDQGIGGPLQAGLDAEEEAFVGLFATQDAATGVRSFLEQGPGKATFSGR